MQNIADTVIYSPTQFLSQNREAILQTLDRKVKGIYLNQSAFKDSKWGGIPLIFAQDHPNDIMLMTDPEKALADVKGRFVGTVKSAHIETVGHPRLMGMLDVTDDEVNTLIDEGKISLSTSLFANNTQNLTKILPTHVLLFIENAKAQPGDTGSWILNKDSVTQIQNVNKKPYGNVEYADPGYQKDGVARYPLNSKKHVKAAWSYINMPKNQAMYTPDQLRLIRAKIMSAAKKYGVTIHNAHLIHKETTINMTDPTQADMITMLAYMTAHPELVTPEMQAAMDAMVGGPDTGATGGAQPGMCGNLDTVQNAGGVPQTGVPPATGAVPPTSPAPAPPTHAEVAAKKKAIVDGLGNLQDHQIVKMYDIMRGMMLHSGLPSAGSGTGVIGNMENTEILQENEVLKAKVTAFEQKEAVSLKHLQETRWQTIKKSLPVGLTHKAEDEAKLKAEFEADAPGFTIQHLADFNSAKGTQPEGIEFQNVELEEEAKEDAKAVEELREVGGMNRRRGR